MKLWSDQLETTYVYMFIMMLNFQTVYKIVRSELHGSLNIET